VDQVNKGYTRSYHERLLELHQSKTALIEQSKAIIVKDEIEKRSLNSEESKQAKK